VLVEVGEAGLAGPLVAGAHERHHLDLRHGEASGFAEEQGEAARERLEVERGRHGREG